MKKISVFATLFILGICILSCKKNGASPEFSQDITNIISMDQINALKSRGMNIYSGNSPSIADGIYLASPYTLLSPYGTADQLSIGIVIQDYKFYFYNQNSGKVSLSYKTVDGITEVENGLGAYISGSGNNFTIFAQVSGISSGINTKSAVVISGQVTVTGINNLQESFVLTYKDGDLNNVTLIPVGTGRIWVDGDFASPIINTY